MKNKLYAFNTTNEKSVIRVYKTKNEMIDALNGLIQATEYKEGLTVNHKLISQPTENTILAVIVKKVGCIQ